MHARNNGEKPTLCFGDEKLFRPTIISSTFGPAQSLGPAFPIPGTRSYGEDSAGRLRPPHAFQGGGCFWEEEKREGEISGNTKALRPFQDLSVLSLPSWCQGKHVALGRCSVHICSSREGAPRGNLGHRPSQPLSVYYSTSQGTGRNRGSRKCQ